MERFPYRNEALLVLQGIALVIATLVSVAPAAIAAGSQKACPSRDLADIRELLNKEPSCQGAVALLEICEFGSSGDVSLGAAVTKKCEDDFLSKLSKVRTRIYDRKQKRCSQKYWNKAGTMYRSFEAFCGVYLARDYSAKFGKPSSARK